jgi:hypothetical protein
MTTPTQERPQLQSKLGRRGQQGQQQRQYGQQPGYPGPAGAIELFSELSPQEFGPEIAKRWKAAEQVVNTVIQAVQQGLLSPVEGLQIVSCAAGSPFAYSAFHGISTPWNTADMAATLSRMVGAGSSST